MPCKMSVVVPVFNKEDSLEECISSLANQTESHPSYEVILVDDGSTDNSLAICEKAENDYPFVRVIEKTNGGVSSARNAGIRASRGEYIMFLDADDSISDNAIKKLIETFDDLDGQTDVVSYTMRYHYADSGKVEGHEREKWLTRTGLYNLEDMPFIAQSTMNVCIRNRGTSNVLFDENLRMGEDQLFITKNLEDKATIGYCKEAEYHYVRYAGSASSRFNSPLYAFEDVMALFEELLQIAQRSKPVSRYAYNLILYNVAWRMKSNKLFPSHLKGDERLRAEQRLRNVLRAIPFDVYCSNPQVYIYHKAYLFKEYVFKDAEVSVRRTNARTVVDFGGQYEWGMPNPTMSIRQCEYWNGRLIISGRIISPAFIYEDMPSLVVDIDGKRTALGLSPSSYDYSMSKIPVARTWAFEFDVETTNWPKQLDIRFEVFSCAGNPIEGVRLDLNPSIHNARFIEDKLYYPYLTLVEKDGKIKAYRRQARTPKKLFLLRDRDHADERALRVECMLAKRRNGKKRVWVYVDLPTSKNRGNALVQMTHDLRQGDGIKRYYVSDFGPELVRQFPQLSGKVVKAGSKEHRALFVNAEVIMHSYLEDFTFMPFTADERRKMGDLLPCQTRVYLQHGVLHAHMPWYFSRDRHSYDCIAVSTRMEHDALLDHYCCNERNVLTTGAPRFDGLDCGETKKKKILFVPSWRAYLVTGSPGKWAPDEPAFLNSSFYKGALSFLEQLSESGILEEYDWALDIKMHPNFGFYSHLFDVGDERIILVSESIDEGEYAIVVTDFSSYVYDFVYSGADIVYYLPDHVEFDAWLNHYNKLELPFEKAFGPYCETSDEAYEAVKAFITGECDRSIYENRRSNFFYHTDKKNCDRLYREMLRLTESSD